MKFSIDKAEAKKALDLVSKCISPRSVLPILQTVCISVDGEGNASFRATNLESHVIAYAKAKVSEPGECCMDSILVNLIGNFDDGDVTFSKGKNRVAVTQKNRKHQIGFMDAAEFPECKQLEGYQKLDASMFVRAISVACTAAATDISRPVLTGCSIDPKRGSVACADGYRMAKYDAVFPGVPTIIPAAILKVVLNELKGTHEEEIEGVFGEWSGVRCSKWEFTFNSLEGTFPDLSSFIVEASKSDGLEIDINKAELTRKLNICNLYASKGGVPFVRLTMKGGELLLSVKAMEIGSVKEYLTDFTATEGDMDIWFNPNYVLTALGTVTSDTAHMKFLAASRPFFMTDPTDPRMLHVFMPGSMSNLDVPVEEEADF